MPINPPTRGAKERGKIVSCLSRPLFLRWKIVNLKAISIRNMVKMSLRVALEVLVVSRDIAIADGIVPIASSKGRWKVARPRVT